MNVLTIKEAEELLRDLQDIEGGVSTSLKDIIILLRDKIEEARDDCPDS